MSERVCRNCGRTYRGLVCHACHPRTKKRREPLDVDGIRAGFAKGSDADCANAVGGVIGGPKSGDKDDSQELAPA